MLQTETETHKMGRRVLAAARALLQRTGLSVAYEHGQWWVLQNSTGASWSAVDAEGPGSYDGFAFERISDGEGE